MLQQRQLLQQQQQQQQQIAMVLVVCKSDSNRNFRRYKRNGTSVPQSPSLNYTLSVSRYRRVVFEDTVFPATDRSRSGISFTWTPAAIREHDDQRQSSMPSCETQPISGTSPSAGREAVVQCIISRSTSREWDLAARLGSPGSGRSGNSVTGLVTLVSRTPSGCRQPRRGFESPTRGSFSTRFHEPFVLDARDTHDRAYLLALTILSRPLDSSRIFNLPRETRLKWDRWILASFSGYRVHRPLASIGEDRQRNEHNLILLHCALVINSFSR